MKSITGVKAIYARHKIVHREYFDTFEEARIFLERGEERGELWAIAILNDSNVFLIPIRESVSEKILKENAVNSLIEVGYISCHFAGKFELFIDSL